MGKHARTSGLGPEPLGRKPRTDIDKFDPEELDERVFAAMNRVVGKLELRAGQIRTAEEAEPLMVRSSLLRLMKCTHSAIRSLLPRSKDDRLELSIPVLPLVRAQIESAFVAIFLEDDDGNAAIYEKGAATNQLMYTFRMQRLLGNHEKYWEPGGQGETNEKGWASQLGMTPAEMDGVKLYVDRKDCDTTACAPRPAEVPTPGQMRNQLKRNDLRRLAWLLYPWYDQLSHYTHSGSMACMLGLLLSEDSPASHPRKATIWQKEIADCLPMSYACLVFVATLFGLRFGADTDLMARLVKAWPETADSTPYGIQLWDNWAAKALGVLGP